MLVCLVYKHFLFLCYWFAVNISVVLNETVMVDFGASLPVAEQGTRGEQASLFREATLSFDLFKVFCFIYVINFAY